MITHVGGTRTGGRIGGEVPEHKPDRRLAADGVTVVASVQSRAELIYGGSGEGEVVAEVVEVDTAGHPVC